MHGLPKTLVSDNGTQSTSTPDPAIGEKSPAGVLMGRKLRTVHKAMLSKKTRPDEKRGNKKNGFAVNTPVYARGYQLGRQWTAALIKKRHGSMIYDVEVGKDTWVRHHNQFRRRLAEPNSDKRHLSLHSLLDTFNLTHVIPPRSQIIDEVIGSVAYSSNKMETFASPDRSVLEDLRVICQRREMLEEMIIIFPRPQYFFYE
ncbi:unnamed protein product [Hymenolepis diminuta]|uniref:Integrase catalytic domain-containing protein n=1 Tax=Hymenolepis diminuta TaxID=6216 RepID=A0A564Y7P4_HYMDI|nr:unnamed protein product [Hymenolepis diminuta]